MLIRRYGLIAYWIFFVLLTLHAGRDPGHVRNRETVPYPWDDVIETCALIGVETAVLYVILRPPTFRRSWRRVVAALLHTSILRVVINKPRAMFDLAGYVYVPETFALITFLALLVLLVQMIAMRCWRLAMERRPA
jgi:hypothetical protein